MERLKEIFEVLSKNKLRTFLTSFGVGWGILMLVIMLGAGKGLENGVRRQFGGMAANSMFMWTQPTSIPYKGFKEGRYFNFNNSDTKALRDNIPEIEYISPGLQLGGWRGANNVKRGDKIGAFEVNGFTPDAQYVKLLKIPEGRFINERDIQEKRKICLIGKRVQQVLFNEGEEIIGQYIEVQGVHFRIVGLFESSRYGDQADNENQSIYIPFTTFQSAYNMGDRVFWYVLTAYSDVPASMVEEKAKNLLKDRHSVHPDDPRGIGGFNLAEEFQKVNMVFVGIQSLSWFVGVLTLFAGIIGISNIMLVIIRERTKEIGIRRSVGATPWSITSQIMLESIILTSVAGSLGLTVGVWLLEIFGDLIEDDAFTNPEVDFSVAITAIIVLIFSGVLAGLMPASRAVRINPVDALRSE
ncbi:MAG: ABC transporter permease [Vicingaceae bacterium]